MSAKRKILIVEDEAILSLSLSQSLEKMGYEVTDTVFSGEQALSAIGENMPDLVLMDIELTGRLDGIETAGEIQQRYGIPIIFLTGNLDEKTVQRANDLRPVGLLSKPYDENEIMNLLKKAVT